VEEETEASDPEGTIPEEKNTRPLVGALAAHQGIFMDRRPKARSIVSELGRRVRQVDDT
jgi:hypothetical protein